MDPSQRKNRAVMIAASALLVALCVCCLITGLGLWYIYRSIPEPAASEIPAPVSADFQPAPDVTESQLIRDFERLLVDTPTTDTDYWLLYGQLVSRTGQPESRAAVHDAPHYHVGDLHIFWIGDEERHEYWQTDATLIVKTDHAYLYVSQGTEFDIDQLDQAADLFEAQIYPTNRRYFGSEWAPGIDNDPRITILVTDQLPDGLAGYFSSSDEYPISMKPRSNQREMIYVTSDYLADLALFGQLLSHELQHMIQWNQDRSEALWVNEALSEMAEEINGYGGVLGSTQYWSDPDIQLTNWADDSNDSYRNYAASKLFFSYLSERFGGYDILRDLSSNNADGIEGIEELLHAGDYQADFRDVFGDWVVANLLDDPTVGEGKFSYQLQGGVEPRFRATLRQGEVIAGWVSQFGSDFVEIDASPGTNLTFDGSSLVQVVSAEPHSGEFAWWSNRRDMMSSSLTRLVDLCFVDEAHLTFWTWFDIEEHFDYGYVAVSGDSGATWTTLAGTHTTAEDPNYANYGYGYTGKSAAWLREEIDLSQYAGETILLRLWYLTDPGLNQPGWLVDDLAIPEIDFQDNAESGESGWTVDGFVRSSNSLFQTYLVQLVEYGAEVTVRQLELDSANSGEIQLRDDTHRAVLIVSGTTRWTSEAAPYRIVVAP